MIYSCDVLKSFSLSCHLTIFFLRRVSIMQLSIWNKVFILDMIAMKDKVKDSEMQQFAESFFANPRVLKLGKELSLSVLG